MININKRRAAGLLAFNLMFGVFSAVCENTVIYAHAEETASLQDGKIEYDELAELIALYNTSLSVEKTEYYDSETIYKSMIKSIQDVRTLLESEADDFEDRGDMESAALYDSNAASLKRSQTSLQDRIDNINEYSSTKSLLKTQNTLTKSAQTLMCSYSQLMSSRESTLKEVEVYASLYNDAQAKEAAGIGTSVETEAAYKDLLAGQASLAAVDDSISQVKASFCLMIGKSSADDIEIMSVPKADILKIDSIDIEADTKRAIGNSYTLQSDRHAIPKKAGSSQKSSVRSSFESENDFIVSFTELYDDLIAKKIQAEAARTAMENAETAYTGLQLQKQLGMISNSDYLQGELTYLKQKASKESADIELLKALETYNWAIEGIM